MTTANDEAVPSSTSIEEKTNCHSSPSLSSSSFVGGGGVSKGLVKRAAGMSLSEQRARQRGIGKRGGGLPLSSAGTYHGPPASSATVGTPDTPSRAVPEGDDRTSATPLRRSESRLPAGMPSGERNISGNGRRIDFQSSGTTCTHRSPSHTVQNVPSPSYLVKKLLSVFAPYPIPTLITASDGTMAKYKENPFDEWSDAAGRSVVTSNDHWRESFLSSRTLTASRTYFAFLICVGPYQLYPLVRPCASLECWMEMSRLKTREQVPTLWTVLCEQYSSVIKRDPDERCFFFTDFRNLPRSAHTARENILMCQKVQKEANGRMVIHYNGHGQRPATPQGEVWVMNDSHSCSERLDIQGMVADLEGPVIVVLDVDSAGAVLHSWKRHYLKSKPNVFFLCACGEGESLPQQPELPADLLTSCLTTPLRMAIRWYLYRSTQVLLEPRIQKEWAEQQAASPALPFFRCLDLVLNAVLDTVAWCTLPDTRIYYSLFRVDKTTRTLFRHFVLANYVGHGAGCEPISHPSFLPEATQHYMWDCWEYTLDKALSLLDPEKEPSGSRREVRANEITNTFFDEQFVAFQLWIRRSGCYGLNAEGTGTFIEGEEDEEPFPERADVLPCILLVLGKPTYCLRAIALLIQYMDVSRAAARSAIHCGVLTYLSRLCHLYPPLLLLVIVLWMQSVRADTVMAGERLRDTENLTWMVHALRLRETTTELIVLDTERLESDRMTRDKIEKLISRPSSHFSASHQAKQKSSGETEREHRAIEPPTTKVTGTEAEKKSSSSVVLPPESSPPRSNSPPGTSRLSSENAGKQRLPEEPLQPIRKSAELSRPSTSGEVAPQKLPPVVKERFVLLRGLTLPHCQAMVCFTLCHFMSLGVEQCLCCWNTNLFGLAYPLVTMGEEGAVGGGGSRLYTPATVPVASSESGTSPTTPTSSCYLSSLTARLELCSWGCLVLASLFRGLRYAQDFASKFFSKGVRPFGLLRHSSNTVRSSYITLLGTVVGVPLCYATAQEQARQVQMEKKLLFQIRDGIMYDASVMVRREVIYFACQLLYAYYQMVEEEEEDFRHIDRYVLGSLWSPDALPRQGRHPFASPRLSPTVDHETDPIQREKVKQEEKEEAPGQIPHQEEEREGKAMAMEAKETTAWRMPTGVATSRLEKWMLEEPEVRVQSSLHASKPTDNVRFADLHLPMVTPIKADVPPPLSRPTLQSLKEVTTQNIIVGLVHDSALMLRQLYLYGDEKPIRQALQELVKGKPPTSQRLQEESRRTMSAVGLLLDMEIFHSSLHSTASDGPSRSPTTASPRTAREGSPFPFPPTWPPPKAHEQPSASPTSSTASTYSEKGPTSGDGRCGHTTKATVSLVPHPSPPASSTRTSSCEKTEENEGMAPFLDFYAHHAYDFQQSEAERIRTKWNADAMRNVVGDMLDRTIGEAELPFATLSPPHASPLPASCSRTSSRLSSFPCGPVSSNSLATHQLLPSILSTEDPIQCATFRVLEPQLIVVTQSQKLYTINYERYYYQEVMEEYVIAENHDSERAVSLASSPSSSSSPLGGRKDPIRSLLVINDLSAHSAFLAVTHKGSFVILKESPLFPSPSRRWTTTRHHSPTSSSRFYDGAPSLVCHPSSPHVGHHDHDRPPPCPRREEEEAAEEAASGGGSMRRYLQTVGTFSAMVVPSHRAAGKSPVPTAFTESPLPLCCSYVSHAAVLFYGGSIGADGQVAIQALSLADERVVDDLHVVSSSPLTALTADLDRRSVYAGFQDGYIRYYDARQKTGTKMTEVTKEMCGGWGGGHRWTVARASPAVLDIGPLSSITASLVGGSVEGSSGHTVVGATAAGVYIFDTRKWREPTAFHSHAGLYEAEPYPAFSFSSLNTRSALEKESRGGTPPFLTRCSISAYAGVLGVCFEDHHYGAFTTKGHLLSQGLLFPMSLSPPVSRKNEKQHRKGGSCRLSRERNIECGVTGTCIVHPIRPFMSVAGDVLFLE